MSVKRNYTVHFERIPEGYTVSVPALPGCVSWGEHRKQALERIEEAILLYLDWQSSKKNPVPTEKAGDFDTAKVSVSVTT